jgi:lipid-A-disaccharide synthase-like uncharacterized protein
MSLAKDASMNELFVTLMDFLSQPWGVCGAFCIMLAVTCFNSQQLQRWFAATGMGEAATPAVLNALNLVGGACLLVNAVLRREIVWEVLEVYFVLIALKGLAQARAQGRAKPASGPESSAAIRRADVESAELQGCASGHCTAGSLPALATGRVDPLRGRHLIQQSIGAS